MNVDKGDNAVMYKRALGGPYQNIRSGEFNILKSLMDDAFSGVDGRPSLF